MSKKFSRFSLSLETLRENIRYDAENGRFFRIKRKGKCDNPDGSMHVYAFSKMRRYVTFKQIKYDILWLAYFLKTEISVTSDANIIPINGDFSDCRFSNIKISEENEIFKIRKTLPDRAPGKLPKGVAFYKPTGKYVSQLQYKGRSIHIGYFDTSEDAAIAYDAVVRDLMETGRAVVPLRNRYKEKVITL